MKKKGKLFTVCVALAVAAGTLTGCGSVTGGKRIVRISHAQSEEHPEHLGLLAFKEYIEENLGDKYEVQIYPNELLGAAQKAIELTQTGAIDFVVARKVIGHHLPKDLRKSLPTKDPYLTPGQMLVLNISLKHRDRVVSLEKIDPFDD